MLGKIKLLLDKLVANGICPLDLKEDNILVDINSLDVQFIDLDGSETRYETEVYLKEFDCIRENAIKSYNIMVERLNRANFKSK